MDRTSRCVFASANGLQIFIEHEFWGVSVYDLDGKLRHDFLMARCWRCNKHLGEFLDELPPELRAFWIKKYQENDLRVSGLAKSTRKRKVAVNISTP